MKIAPYALFPTRGKSHERFGSQGPIPPWLASVDFMKVGTTMVAQNKVIYAACIASRLWKSRSFNEFMETLRRDAMGWYSWFMGNPLMQTGVVLFLIPLISKGSRELMVRPLNQNAGLGQKILWTLFAPNKRWQIISDKQLEQRQEQIVQGMRRLGRSHLIANTEKLFRKTMVMRSLVSLIGLATAILLLGIGLPWLNIIFTAANVRKKQQEAAKNKFAQQPHGNFTIQG